MGKFADIIVDISHEKVDRPFQYRIPERLQDKIDIGMAVNIPFGKGNKLIKGYVMDITDIPSYDETKLKEIISIVEKGVTATDYAIRLASWLKKNYGSTMIAALKTVLPVKQKTKQLIQKTVFLDIEQEQAKVLAEEFVRKHQMAKARVMKELSECMQIPQSLITSKLNITSQTLQSLEKAKFIHIEEEEVFRTALPKNKDSRWNQGEKKVLSDKQQLIVDEITNEYRQGIRRTYLIHGITGSGKTEVYMKLIEDMVKQQKQTIVLIPEIALTFQTLMRFYQYFGERVSVLNSKMSMGERSDQLERAARGEIDIMIGPRSALFTPFSNLGLIIIDEEHENSYKSEQMPKYHAREVAAQICRMQNASLVLGSATPSLEAYYAAKQNEIRLFELKERLTGGTLPNVDVVDLREELKNGNRSIFSVKLRDMLEDRLQKGQQSMLFINRRGYAGFVSCRSCGYVAKCPHCDVSLSEHRNGKLVCHYCGYEVPKMTSCPQCSSKYILGFRAGTQQIEEALQKTFPAARILRMDADTTKNKDSYEKILSRFANEEADILVGTQMIVKGHDFPNVTLVGILAADLSLHTSDYRAAERTFQLLTQAAGRAGRGNLPGEVVIQTYNPEHYAVVHAANQDYEGFYKEEIEYRDLMMYPPVSHLLAVLILSADELSGDQKAREMADYVKKEFFQERALVIGPSSASIGKINDVYRTVFFVKHREYGKLVKIKDDLEKMISDKEWNADTVQFDFDPMNAY